MDVVQDLGVLFISILGLERGKEVGFLPALQSAVNRANLVQTMKTHEIMSKTWYQ